MNYFFFFSTGKHTVSKTNVRRISSTHWKAYYSQGFKTRKYFTPQWQDKNRWLWICSYRPWRRWTWENDSKMFPTLRSTLNSHKQKILLEMRCLVDGLHFLRDALWPSAIHSYVIAWPNWKHLNVSWIRWLSCAFVSTDRIKHQGSADKDAQISWER